MVSAISSIHDLSDTEVIAIMTGPQSKVGLNDTMEAQVVVATSRCVVAPAPTLFDDIRRRYAKLIGGQV